MNCPLTYLLQLINITRKLHVAIAVPHPSHTYMHIHTDRKTHTSMRMFSQNAMQVKGSDEAKEKLHYNLARKALTILKTEADKPSTEPTVSLIALGAKSNLHALKVKYNNRRPRETMMHLEQQDISFFPCCFVLELLNSGFGRLKGQGRILVEIRGNGLRYAHCVFIYHDKRGLPCLQNFLSFLSGTPSYYLHSISPTKSCHALLKPVPVKCFSGNTLAELQNTKLQNTLCRL
jgi:hypothetical protein